MWSSIVVRDQMVRSTNLVPSMFDAFQETEICLAGN